MLLIDSTKKYYKGNTHMHTTNSDGDRTPREAMRLYKAAGYDFIVITDHWSHHPTLDFEGMLVMSGAEYDFSFADQVLHVCGIFPNEAASLDFTRDMDYQRVLTHIREVGGAAIAAHPNWSLNTTELLLKLDPICATEVYNSFSGPPWNLERADSSHILDLTAVAGRCIPQLAADDSHRYKGEQCLSYTMLQADELTPESVIDALKRGSFYASQGPSILDAELANGELHIHTSPVSHIHFYSNLPWTSKRCFSGTALTEQSYVLHPGERFVRCVVTDNQGRKAWLSPIDLTK